MIERYIGNWTRNEKIDALKTRSSSRSSSTCLARLITELSSIPADANFSSSSSLLALKMRSMFFRLISGYDSSIDRLMSRTRDSSLAARSMLKLRWFVPSMMIFILMLFDIMKSQADSLAHRSHGWSATFTGELEPENFQ